MNVSVLDLLPDPGTHEDAELSRLFAPLRDAVVLLDDRGRVIFLNSAAERVLGYGSDEIRGRDLELLFPTMPCREARAGTDGADLVVPVSGLRRDGTSLEATLVLGDIHCAGRVLQRVIVRESAPGGTAPGEALQWARLDLLGRLAPSLAHELSQPLSALANLAESCREVAPDAGAPDTRQILDEIVRQAGRAKQIVRAMRTFALRGQGAQGPESVATLVDDARVLALCDAGGRKISVETEIDPGLRVLANRVLAQQALVNLIRNAADAMGAVPRRLLRIVGRPGQDGWAEIRVEDSGPGVAPDLAGRVFSASLSTKPDGLGLGLSICKDIVEHHGGTIWLENRPPHGATFALTLPRFTGVTAYA